MQTTALASRFPECPSNDHLIMDTKSCAKQRDILENAEAHARTVWLRQPACQEGDASQGLQCQNSRTRLPNYHSCPRENNQFSSSPNTKWNFSDL